MKRQEKKELAEMTLEQLRLELRKLQIELGKARLAKKVKKLENTAKVTQLQHQLARIKTKIREYELKKQVSSELKVDNKEKKQLR